MYVENHISPEMLAFFTNGEMGEGDEGNMVTCGDDLNTRHDDEMYFLIGHSNQTVELFGCPSRDGLMALAIYFRTFLMTTPSMIFRGTIQNPLELPYELERDEVVLILFADHSLRLFYNMEAATYYIEEHIEKYSASTIDDFAIIIGEELEFDNEEWSNLVIHGVMGNGWY